jgi:hypothetical protein
MAERRSLGDAMAMSPEKLAFIKQQPVATTQPPIAAPAAEPEKTIELETTALEEKPAKPVQAKTPRVQGRGKPIREELLSATEMLDQVLVPVTIRLQHRTSEALRRAYLQQRLNRAKPDTQQDIVEAAVTAWLADNGFFKDE